MRYLLLLILFLTTNVWALPKLPDVAPDALLTAEQKVGLRNNLDGHILKRLTPAKNDFVDSKHRGTVEYDPKFKNYSYHNVIIPNGTVVTEYSNFTQADMHTNAITGKNLTFRNCNLTNVQIDPSWTVETSRVLHQRWKTVVEDGKAYEVLEIEKPDKTFREVLRNDITPTP